ncbi:NUDIX domain-containing protein [Vagococcus sp. DIV0080]|uniref:NUDIX domain-containing protein n=1 Tax=Candidatus Vagococcus giribetii TaxID=2230876 RepID=A0ABS3HSJ4_9ENTE|nr:NUDIX domain-containing protein [Vagococcus sp. DIV0080]MBO0475836.1 NUDIX domain-containing protein [Vagococcus sp. DIV0080]
MVEKWDIYDVDHVKTGKVISKNEPRNKEEYRIVIGACIFNTKGQLLVQKRQTDKQSWPNYWDISVSGSVISGETSSEGAKRELQEELGLTFDIVGQLPQLSVSFEGGFEDYYLIEADVDLNDVVIQEEEVQEVAWMTLAEINELIAQDIFIPYHHHLISLFFEMKTAYGSYRVEG